MTQAWSLRETDLFGYQRKLDRIDEARINGNFVDAEGQQADIHAQRVGIIQGPYACHSWTDLTFVYRRCCT